jgi:hypothetical protein
LCAKRDANSNFFAPLPNRVSDAFTGLRIGDQRIVMDLLPDLEVPDRL